MERTMIHFKAGGFWNCKALGALALGVLLSAVPVFAQQDPQAQPDQPQAPAAAPQNQQEQTAPPPAQQPQAQQDQQMGQDQQPAQTAPDQNDAPPPPPPPPPPPVQNQAPAPPRVENRPPRVTGPLPEALTIPAGTIVQVRTSDWLSSDRNHKGDQFIATLAQPIVVGGWVVMRRGQTITGTVTDAQRAGRVKGVSKLQLDLSQLTLVDGQLVPVQTALLNASAGTSNGRDAAAVGLTTGTGAAIGAAAAGGPGAAIGAGAGFVASVLGVLVTRGKPTIIPPEDVLTFKLETPVTVSTARGQMAFRAVTPQDYAPAQRPVRPRLRPYPPPPYGYYPYGYYGPYPPAAYYGVYGRP